MPRFGAPGTPSAPGAFETIDAAMRALLQPALAVTLLASVAAAGDSPRLVDIDGVDHGALDSADRAAAVLFFVMSDCPISNQYSPEIDRICTQFGPDGVDCFLVYVDPELDATEVRRHQLEYGHEGRPAILDSGRSLVRAAGATITPEAAVFSSAGELVYRGRINNLYAALGKPRRRPTVHDLRRALDQMLAGRPVAEPRTEAVGCYIPPAEL